MRSPGQRAELPGPCLRPGEQEGTRRQRRTQTRRRASARFPVRAKSSADHGRANACALSTPYAGAQPVCLTQRARGETPAVVVPRRVRPFLLSIDLS